MPLHMVRQDITKMKVDAIVNAANRTLLGGGGVDGAIHRGAGPRLLEECRGLGGCETGEAKITKGYDLPCEYVIHTVGPVWLGGDKGEAEALAACYRNSLLLALEQGCRSVAFPLISTGAYGYPKDQALRIAVDTVSSVLLASEDLTVYLVFFDRTSFQLGEKLYWDLSVYIDDSYAKLYAEPSDLTRRRRKIAVEECARKIDFSALPSPIQARRAPKKEKEPSLEETVLNLDESFTEMLLRKIDEKGITDAQCYKKANVDRKLFSKIRKDKYYKPSKPTALAFAVALELSLAETEELLKKAGFALSHSNKFDLIIEYFIKNGNYDVFVINAALFAFDQPLLGL